MLGPERHASTAVTGQDVLGVDDRCHQDHGTERFTFSSVDTRPLTIENRIH